MAHAVGAALACLPLRVTQPKGHRPALSAAHTPRCQTPATPTPCVARRRLCRSAVRCRGGGVTTAAASALATATAGHSLWLADVLFSCATAYGIALFGVLVAGLLVPHASRASAWTRAVVATLWTFLPLEVLYLTLLVLSWQPDNLALMLPGSLSDALATGQPQFFPRLDTIMVLLSRRVTAASAWAHLLTVNSFAARYVFLNARARRVPAAHSILLCLLAGPAGLASHLVTRRLVARAKAGVRGPEPH